MAKTIEIAAARGQQMSYATSANQDNLTIGLGVGSVLAAGEYTLERRDLMAGDAQVTVNNRPIQAVFAVRGDVSIKGTALRALAGNANVELAVNNGVAKLARAIVVDEMPRWDDNVMNPRTHTMGSYVGDFRAHIAE